MKATVYVRLKSEVLDPQGEAVRRALAHMGVSGVTGVRIGKLVEIELDAASPDDAQGLLAKAADELLANPVMEDYEVVVGAPDADR
ncbi:MAG: phosphoribosylformylglycinamidine synthase subunit PurS [Deltaproteobacteria bacterium]|nr:phosphoribosylformylglycinamidine synthase subunit PurS [Deltaproteobacteria bacterium]